MIQLSKLVEIGFSYEQATVLDTFFRNVGYLTVGKDSVLSSAISKIPANNVLVLTPESVVEYLKPDSQEFMDITNVFVQNGNLEPNRGRVNNVIVYFATLASGQTMGDLVDEFISINANWSQLLVNTTTTTDILSIAARALVNNRLYIAQTDDDNVADKEDENIALQLKALNNYNTILCYHTTEGESLAAGLAGICANPNLGATGILYSTVTNITPEDYATTTNSNLDDQNVVYYSSVNAVNGGGVSQYASPIVMGKNMISGENSKRRYIRFCVDILLKAKMIDFLKKKLPYEDVSADIGLSMAKGVLKQLQTNGLIKKDSIVTVGDVTKETLGWEIRTVYPSVLRDENETLYNTQTYKFVGYYRDTLIGEKVEIDLAIDPTDATKSLLGF